MRTVRLFIDGDWRAATGGGVFESVNPATEEPWAAVAAGAIEDVDRAVAAARRAHRSGVWRSKPAAERAAVLSAIAALVLDRQDELAAAEVQDGGGTIRKANT